MAGILCWTCYQQGNVANKRVHMCWLSCRNTEHWRKFVYCRITCYWILIIWSIHRLTLIFIAGYSFYFISDRITNICLFFVGNTGYKIFIAVESSSHSSLSLSNILHINIVDRRFTFSIYSSTTFTKGFYMHINRYVHN